MMYRRVRAFTYELFAPRLGGRLGIAFDWGIMTLIVVNIVAVLLETVEPVSAAYRREL